MKFFFGCGQLDLTVNHLESCADGSEGLAWELLALDGLDEIGDVR